MQSINELQVWHQGREELLREAEINWLARSPGVSRLWAGSCNGMADGSPALPHFDTGNLETTAILAAENPSLRVYWADPSDMRTQMHQEAFPDEDISDRPLPKESVPGLIELLKGAHPSGRYKLRDLPGDDGPSAIQELRVALTVENFDRSARFYREGFGLPVVDE